MATGLSGFHEFRTPSMGAPQPAFDADPPTPIGIETHREDVYPNHRDRNRDVTWITTGSRLPSQYQRSHGQPSPYPPPSPYDYQPHSTYGHQPPSPYNLQPPSGAYNPQPPTGPYRPQPPSQFQGQYQQNPNAQAGPSRPLPEPMYTRGFPIGTIPSENLDEEYMTIGPDDYEEAHEQDHQHLGLVNGDGDEELEEEDTAPVLPPQPQPLEKKKSGFVGGFVKGLKKLTWQRKKGASEPRPDRVDTLPQYQSDPNLPAVGMLNGAPVTYIEGMDMPRPEPSMEVPTRAGSFTSRQSQPDQQATEYSYNDGRSHPPPSTNGHSIGGPPAADPSSNDHVRQSTGGHSTTHSNPPYETQTNDTHGPITVSNHHEPLLAASIPPTSTHGHGGAGYSIHTPHTHPISHGEESPVFIEPLPASDYDKMSPPHSVAGASLSTRVMRVGEFFTELYHLPWIGRHGIITADFVPTGPKGQPVTWYPGGVRNGNLHGREDFDIDGAPAKTRPRQKETGRGWRRDPSTYYSRDYDYRYERQRERDREREERERERRRARSPSYDDRRSPPYEFYDGTRSPPYEAQSHSRARTTTTDYDKYRNRSPPGPYGYSSQERRRHRDRDRGHDRERHRRRRDTDRSTDRPRYPQGYAPEYAHAQPLYVYPNTADPNNSTPGQPPVIPGDARPLYVIAPTPPRPFIPPPVSAGGRGDRSKNNSGEGRRGGERSERERDEREEGEEEPPGGFHAYAMSRAPTNGGGAQPV
ncbi:hypothetical protein HWV62_28021 [Athelia sp. TMB]|nr:hypothetical protein HWV62_28021 [Athelia sp. TMB]